MSVTDNRPKVAVVGSGGDLAMVAFSAAKALESLNPAVIAVDVGDGASASCISTFSDMKAFNDSFGINENAFVDGVEAGVNFGIGFSFSELDEAPFIFNDGPYGLLMHNSPFHQLFHIYRQRHPTKQLDSYSLSANLAKAGRFAPRSEQSNSVFSAVSHGYTFAASAFEKYFRRLALGLNVTFVRSTDVKVSEGESGIESVTTSTGQLLCADLYIDCSAQGALVNKRNDSHRVSSINTEYVPPWQFSAMDEPNAHGISHLYTKVESTPGGYAKQIVHEASIYCEKFEYAINARGDGGEALQFPSALQRPWVDNCVALGAASMTVPNLIPGNYNVLQGQLLQLFELWSGNRLDDAVAEQFNETSAQTLDHVVDLANIQLAKHPHLGADVRLTDSNRSRVALFESSGALRLSDRPIVSDQHWPALLMALGFEQKGTNLQATALPLATVVEGLDKLEALLQKATNAAPPYRGSPQKNGKRNEK